MVKSKAQRMREYREIKKVELGEKLLRRENRRVKRYFVPVSQLSKEKTSEMPNLIEPRNRGNFLRAITLMSSDILNSPLVVKLLAMKSHSSAGNKRTSGALAKAYREIERLSDQKKKISAEN